MIKYLYMLLLLIPVTLFGEPVSGIYDVVVRVNGTDEPSREQAIRAAMREVMVKVTGERNASQRASNLVKNASRYVQQYAYREGRNGETLLWVQFDPMALQQVLPSEGLSTWGSERPTTLVWLVADQGGNQRLMGANDPSNIPEGLKRRAAAWSLPVLFPLLDLQDRSSLTVNDIRMGSQEPILRASQRYAAEAVVTGIISGTQGDGWLAHWTVYHGGSKRSWSTRGNETISIVKAGVDKLAETLARQSPEPEVPGDGKGIELLISGVASADQYARVESYLRSLDAVSDLQVRELEPPDRVRMYVVAPGRAHAVLRSITTGTMLQQVPGNKAEYRLTPLYR